MPSASTKTPAQASYIVVLDPGSVTDNATYLDSCVPSSGVRHLLVNGTFVVRDGDVQVDAYPGLPVRALSSTCGPPG